MKMRFAMATLATFLAGGSSVLAQVDEMGISPLSATSPLAIESSSPVEPTGIPLGATEMTAAGTSPALPSMGCSGAAGPMSQTATALFDGGGMTGAASSACAGTGGTGTSSAGTGGAETGNTGSSMPPLSTSTAGRAGIPLGSTQINNPGLSPPLLGSTTFVSPIVPSTPSPQLTIGSPPPSPPPCPVTGTFPDTRRAAARTSNTTTAAAPGC
jgi:hypothetical protein